ncbi:ATP-binding cassette domain-containing protein [Paracoccus sp. 11-3]|uniref:ATP-binding cassette domain-containing protein n=1 Tax=Paracoccus amoyensis TaxID=2760093 RepID=A0A926JC43_9RHOB|nr:ATP-binding cassette domain-containing protein [Paracoccus amoyensis]
MAAANRGRLLRRQNRRSVSAGSPDIRGCRHGSSSAAPGPHRNGPRRRPATSSAWRRFRLGASEDENTQAAAQAQLSSLIHALPDGLDTVVCERGVMLSGGQRQRVAIARAFLKNPPIMILDEATSALDSQTEREIQQALDRLSEGRTTPVIAHRLGTIRNADRIVVMHEERIVEPGSHDEPVLRDGVYAGVPTDDCEQQPGTTTYAPARKAAGNILPCPDYADANGSLQRGLASRAAQE